MRYQWSAETEQRVAERQRLLGLTVERIITDRLTAGELTDIDILVGYVPVIMNPEWAERYPARTKVSHKHRILDCAPQLDWEKFTGKSIEAAAKEYIRGIVDCLPLLSKLKLSETEIRRVEEFFSRVSQDLQSQLHDIP